MPESTLQLRDCSALPGITRDPAHVAIEMDKFGQEGGAAATTATSSACSLRQPLVSTRLNRLLAEENQDLYNVHIPSHRGRGYRFGRDSGRHAKVPGFTSNGHHSNVLNRSRTLTDAQFQLVKTALADDIPQRSETLKPRLVVTSMRKFPTLYAVLLIVVLEFQ